MRLLIEPMLDIHWPRVAEIYNEGIATGHATFQSTAPDWQTWNADHVQELRFVAKTESGEIAGWSALVPVSDRCAYAGVGEVSVYVASKFYGQGFGHALLQRLIDESEKLNYWTLQAGIFPENVASLKLHEKCGFRVVGIREKLGKLNGVWRDVVFLERRSNRVGLD